MRDVRVVRAGEAKLCEVVRETIFLSLRLGIASWASHQGPFVINFCAQSWVLFSTVGSCVMAWGLFLLTAMGFLSDLLLKQNNLCH